MKTLIATLALFALLFIEALRQRRAWQFREQLFAAVGSYDLEAFVRRASHAFDQLAKTLREWNPTMEEATRAFAAFGVVLRSADETVHYSEDAYSGAGEELDRIDAILKEFGV